MADMEWEDDGWEGLVADVVAESVEAAEVAVNDAANHLRNAVLDKLEGIRSGRAYRVSKDGPLHIASAPGEPPASLTGHLRQNINRTDVTVDGDEVYALVGVDGDIVPYARRLELGGYHIAVNGRAVYLAPRPYLRPAFFEQEATVINILERSAGSR